MGVEDTRGLEERISRAMKRFMVRHVGERPKTVRTQILRDTIIIRLQGISPPAERNLSRSHDGAKTIKELKDKIFADAAPLLEALIKKLTKTDVVDIHSSFDVKTDERIEIVTLLKDFEMSA